MYICIYIYTKTLYDQGKYRLALGFQCFFVDPTVWIRWDPARRHQHVQAFMAYIPSSYEKYKKLADAGLKRQPGQKRRADMPEVDLFQDFTVSETTTDFVKSIKLRKSKMQWEVKLRLPTVDIFNPMRFNTKMHMLVHRLDKSGFPVNVKQCEECKVSFSSADIIAVKTTACKRVHEQVWKAAKDKW